MDFPGGPPCANRVGYAAGGFRLEVDALFCLTLSSWYFVFIFSWHGRFSHKFRPPMTSQVAADNLLNQKEVQRSVSGCARVTVPNTPCRCLPLTPEKMNLCLTETLL